MNQQIPRLMKKLKYFHSQAWITIQVSIKHEQLSQNITFFVKKYISMNFEVNDPIDQLIQP